jgi:hypothetical protein
MFYWPIDDQALPQIVSPHPALTICQTDARIVNFISVVEIRLAIRSQEISDIANLLRQERLSRLINRKRVVL